MRKLWMVLAKYFALAFLVALVWNGLKSNPPVAAMACGIIVAIFISYAIGMFQRPSKKEITNNVQAVEPKRGRLIRPAEVPCRNCGRMVSNLPSEDNANSDIMTKCPHCGAVWTKSWRDFGIDMDDLDGSIYLQENPSPQNVQFGVATSDTPAPKLEKSLLDIMSDSALARCGKNITRLVTLLENCAESEKQYKQLDISHRRALTKKQQKKPDFMQTMPLSALSAKDLLKSLTLKLCFKKNLKKLALILRECRFMALH